MNINITTNFEKINKSDPTQFMIKIDYDGGGSYETGLKNKTAIVKFFKSELFKTLLDIDKGET